MSIKLPSPSEQGKKLCKLLANTGSKVLRNEKFSSKCVNKYSRLEKVIDNGKVRYE